MSDLSLRDRASFFPSADPDLIRCTGCGLLTSRFDTVGRIRIATCDACGQIFTEATSKTPDPLFPDTFSILSAEGRAGRAELNLVRAAGEWLLQVQLGERGDLLRPFELLPTRSPVAAALPVLHWARLPVRTDLERDAGRMFLEAWPMGPQLPWRLTVPQVQQMEVWS